MYVYIFLVCEREGGKVRGEQGRERKRERRGFSMLEVTDNAQCRFQSRPMSGNRAAPRLVRRAVESTPTTADGGGGGGGDSSRRVEPPSGGSSSAETLTELPRSGGQGHARQRVYIYIYIYKCVYI